MSRVSLIALCLALSFVVVANVNCMRCGRSISEKIAQNIAANREISFYS